MTIPGETTIKLVNTLLDEGVDHIVLLMRHSAREFAPGRHDLLNPLTDEGRELARQMGEKLPASLTVSAYSSPAERCVETADLILKGHADKGGRVTRNRVMEALGVFYVLDQMRMFKSMQAAGGLVTFLNQWFDGNIAQDILMPADMAAGILGRIAHERLIGAQKSSSNGPRLDLFVSHDFTLYTIKDRLLNLGTEVPVNFLDGVAFFQREGDTHGQGHHGGSVPIGIG